jgi:hypothetical protein
MVNDLRKSLKRAEQFVVGIGNACFGAALVFGAIFLVGFPNKAGIAFKQMGALAGLYILPGFAYRTFAVFMEERKRWSLIASISLGSVQAILFAAMLLFGLSAESWPVITVCSFLLLLILPMIVFCILAFPATSSQRARGFDPVLPPRDAN